MNAMAPTTEETGVIIAGSGKRAKHFIVSVDILKSSPVIRDWIEVPESLPKRLKKDGALNLAECEPEVVADVVRFLENPRSFRSCRISSPSEKAIFYTKVYKLALCLAVDKLCILSLQSIKESITSIKSFLEVLLLAQEGDLIENSRFRTWVVSYILRHADDLKAPEAFISTIPDGGSIFWRLCIAFVSIVAQMPKIPAKFTGVAPDLLPTPSSQSSSSPQIRESTSSSHLNPEAHRSRPYSYSPEQSPCAEKRTRGEDAVRMAKKGRYQATIEEISECQ